MRIWEDEPCLVVVAGPVSGRYHPIKDELVIGRESGADIVVGSPTVSRRHAVIRRETDGCLVIQDLGSRNGTRVNGARIETKNLELGDSIQVADGMLVVIGRSLLGDHLDEDLLIEPSSLESLGRLAGSVGHKFNNLMSVVLSNVSFLRNIAGEGMELQAQRLEALMDIEQAAQQASDMTRRMLGFDELKDREAEPLDATQLVTEVAAVVKNNFEPKIKVLVNAEPELNMVGDRSKLHTMMMNLCANAHDAMPEGGTLTISARMGTLDDDAPPRYTPISFEQYLIITVSDTGVGMDGDVRTHAFEPLFSTKRDNSVGLGLTIVYGIVRAHNGYVSVESKPGEGSNFKVLLPRYGGQSLDEQTEPLVFEAADECRGILLVEDNDVVATSIQRLLKQLGYEVFYAANGEEALAQYDEHADEIDVVMLDLVMPVMDGATAFEQLKRRDPALRVIIASGRRQRDLRKIETFAKWGMPIFLSKPYSQLDLSEAIRLSLLKACRE